MSGWRLAPWRSGVLAWGVNGGISWRVVPEDHVERDAERGARSTLRIAHERAADHLDRHAVLERYRGHHRRVAGGGGGVGPGPMIGEENLGESAVREAAHRRREAHP